MPEHYDGTELDYLSTRKGMAPAQVAGMFAHVAEQARGEGLNYRFDDVVVANSFTAHRLIHLAAAHGGAGRRRRKACSATTSSRARTSAAGSTSRPLAWTSGSTPSELDELFTTDKYADDVRLDFVEEGRALGISGVPFFLFVIDRKFGLSGAQPAETFTEALEQAWRESRPLVMVGAADSGDAGSAPAAAGEACGPDGCAV